MATKDPIKIAANRAKEKAWMRRYRQDNPLPSILAKVKARAKKNNIPFNLTIDDLIIPEVCPILGIPLSFNRTGKNGPSGNSPSLDRINPELGYIKGNIAFISHKANAAKSNLTLEQLEALVAYMKTHAR